MARGDSSSRGGNRSGNRGGGENRGGGNRSRNNNPEGRNQYSGGMMTMARERPLTAALGAAAAVGAGVFLWSRRNQISDQLSNLSDQIGEWTDGMRSGGDDDDFGSMGTEALVTSGSRSSARKSGGSRKSQQQISEEALSLKETGEI